MRCRGAIRVDSAGARTLGNRQAARAPVALHRGPRPLGGAAVHRRPLVRKVAAAAGR